MDHKEIAREELRPTASRRAAGLDHRRRSGPAPTAPAWDYLRRQLGE